MVIGIDGRLLERETTGIGRIVCNILNFILKFDKENEYFLFSYNRLANYQKSNFRNILIPKNDLVPLKIYSAIWLNLILPRYLKKYNVELFFSPSGLIPKMKIGCKTLILVCDTFHKIDRNFHSLMYRKYLNFLLTDSIVKSNLVLTISQNSKKDIMNFYRVPEEKIKVIYLAAEEKFQPRCLDLAQKENLRKKYNLPEKFILYVGIIDYRKNIDAIIEVADLLVNKEKRNMNFVLIGRAGLRYKEIINKSRKIKNGHILFLNYVEGEDLPFLYNLADIFLFPSLYEGFGLPPLEAMQSGIPVIASNSASLPEVLGEGGIMHPPNDCNSFARDIIRLLEDRKFYNQMKEKGIMQSKKFRWAKTGQEFLNLIKNVI